ncbi:hypothetical protein [Legionella brunensis]|uniref:Uncharacterized protein n=1 Tax=Legionella brunensis TaxID=29422 RepID=A0A0W0SK45_9GAMM|nr:hypothetical protein [Legionella brunensis]KTC83767.1 hypothetical protein Lbru_1665 [Legionella brunensis]
MSQYGVELFIQNGYKNFDECLQIIEKARQLKESFYNSLLPSNKALGITNYAFSDYDLGLLYYLSGRACSDERLRCEKLKIAA